MFQTKVSVFEKAVILDHPIFLTAEALKLRQGQLHFFKWNHVFFFMKLLLHAADSTGPELLLSTSPILTANSQPSYH